MSALLPESSPAHERLTYFDALRGVCIICVVHAHLLARMESGGYSTVLGTIINTFFLNLFFFLSGFFAYRACTSWNLRSVSSFFKRKIQALLICPLVFFSLYAYCQGNDIWGWTRWGFCEYWFTIVLFQFFLIFLASSLVAKLFNRDWLMEVCMITASCAALVVLIKFRGQPPLWTVLTLENTCKYLQFFTFGILCRKHFPLFTSLISRDWFRSACIVSFVVFLILIYQEDFKASGGALYQTVHDILIRYASVLMLVSYFYSKRHYFELNNKCGSLLTRIGSRTLDIYMLHYFLLPELPYMKEFLTGGNMVLIQLFVGLSLSGLVITVCLLLSSLLRSSQFLSAWLFGVKR